MCQYLLCFISVTLPSCLTSDNRGRRVKGILKQESSCLEFISRAERGGNSLHPLPWRGSASHYPADYECYGTIFAYHTKLFYCTCLTFPPVYNQPLKREFRQKSRQDQKKHWHAQVRATHTAAETRVWGRKHRRCCPDTSCGMTVKRRPCRMCLRTF